MADPGDDNFFRDRYTFHIKTIQIFNKDGQPQWPPILAEQVNGSFDAYRLYDTSFVHNDGKIFYFKRIFKNKKASPPGTRKNEKKYQRQKSERKNLKTINV